jgi:hypothetical protein
MLHDTPQGAISEETVAALFTSFPGEFVTRQNLFATPPPPHAAKPAMQHSSAADAKRRRCIKNRFLNGIR